MIVCVGTTPVWQRSMVFGRVRPDDVNRAARVADYASGKGVNVARVLHALGEEAVAAGFAGGDRGAALVRDLEAAGVRPEFVTTDAPTRQCITVIDKVAGTATELVEESHPVTADDWGRLYERLAGLLPGAAAWVFSGSLPPGVDQSFYAECLRRFEADRPPVVVLDARGEALRQALGRPGFVAKMNRDELAATVDFPLDGDAALRRAVLAVMPRGGAVVVTAGAAGAFVAEADQFWRVRPPAVKAVSAVGSGDAFTAGLAAALVCGEPLGAACVLAAACGAANAMTERAGFLAAGDVWALMPRVRVEAWDD